MAGSLVALMVVLMGERGYQGYEWWLNGATAQRPDEAAMIKERAEIVQHEIGLLPDQQQAVTRLWLRGIGYREIARLRGTTEAACRKGFCRAKDRLRLSTMMQQLWFDLTSQVTLDHCKVLGVDLG